ncbi:hypothetical protein CRUP_014140 [Coryphaenoides rupestris]|nr:hypothetical protein CRUP_014140 [Coryphaenoides rupestris]
MDKRSLKMESMTSDETLDRHGGGQTSTCLADSDIKDNGMAREDVKPPTIAIPIAIPIPCRATRSSATDVNAASRGDNRRKGNVSETVMKRRHGGGQQRRGSVEQSSEMSGDGWIAATRSPASPRAAGLRMSRTLTAMADSSPQPSRPEARPAPGPYISAVTNRTANLVIRGSLLFSVGVFLSLVLNLLQVQRNVTLFPPDVISSIFSSAWWVPPCSVIGLLYPCIDIRLGEPHKFKREWSSVMRCVAVFVGINHASAKVDFANNVQLSLTLAVLSVGLWWTFDRSRSGFGLGVGIALLATLATQVLVYNEVFQ